MNPSITIVIPLYNGAAFIPACLNAVVPQVRAHGAAEVIVVDNASTDSSEQALAPFETAIRRHRMDFNAGFASAVNVGIQFSQGEIIVLLNQDAIVQPGWLDALLTRFQSSPQAAIVGCKCVRADGTIDHAGGAIRLPLFYTMHLGFGEPDSPQYNHPGQHEYVTGAALAIRRAALERVGMFDQGFYPAYYEETDLCLRARKAGYEVWYEPAAVVLHQSGQTPLEHMSVDRIATFHRNRLRCLIKHTEPEQIGAVLRSAEMAEIESPQAISLLTGRSIAYRDILRSVLNGDPALSSRIMPDAIEALAQCHRQAYRRAEQILDDSTLPISQRINMAPRTETWQDLQRGLGHILTNLAQLTQNIEGMLRYGVGMPSGVPSLGLDAGLPTSAQPETASPVSSPPDASTGKHKSAGHSAQESAQWHQAELLELHRKMGEIDGRLAQLAAMGEAQPSPGLPGSRLAWLRATWRSIRALPVLAASVKSLEQRERVNAARVTSLIGETRGLIGHVSNDLIAQGQYATQIAADTEEAVSAQRQALAQLANTIHTQRQSTAQCDIHLANALASVVSATRTACQFLHECITWQTDITRRVHELGRHTSALVESESTSAIIQALQEIDINPTRSDSTT